MSPFSVSLQAKNSKTALSVNLCQGRSQQDPTRAEAQPPPSTAPAPPQPPTNLPWGSLELWLTAELVPVFALTLPVGLRQVSQPLLISVSSSAK